MMRCNSTVASLTLACLLSLSACGADQNVSIDGIRSALEERNYGVAAELADKLTTRRPVDAEAWIAAADAKAASGSRPGALNAIEHALNNGMHDSARLDNDPWLDDLRASDEYHALLVRFGFAQQDASVGDTSITESSAGTLVRAGDVSVTLPNTK